MKRFVLFVIFFLVFVEVVDGVVYSWIFSVNFVDMDEGKQMIFDNNIKENLIL